jgi:hypothetical protein
VHNLFGNRVSWRNQGIDIINGKSFAFLRYLHTGFHLLVLLRNKIDVVIKSFHLLIELGLNPKSFYFILLEMRF